MSATVKFIFNSIDIDDSSGIILDTERVLIIPDPSPISDWLIVVVGNLSLGITVPAEIFVELLERIKAHWYDYFNLTTC